MRFPSKALSLLFLAAVLVVLQSCGAGSPLSTNGDLFPGPEGVPGQTLANLAQQRSVMGLINFLAGATCQKGKVVNTEITGQPTGSAGWTERWTVDWCGEGVSYRVTYTPGSGSYYYPGVGGGTAIHVDIEK